MNTPLTAFYDDLKQSYQTGNITEFIIKSSDLLLAFAVALMAALMIVPLPTWILDLLLTLNITVGVVLLMASVYVHTGTQIAVFPTLLLITTLYRLALDISATRLILLEADAGEVIQAFGEFVVGGDFIVGAVIFIIIALVQFIVVAKGAERVGEVAARFTLDSLPGRQTLIESDLRAGLISHEQAQEMRHQLGVEMQFFSRMEGAMRFIKGDAIAALIISAINIGAGFLIGVAMKKMPLQEAAETYTILTIGNGLVSQIPALLISIAAGITISRVTREKTSSNLGRDVALQFLGQPKAIMVSSVILLALALIPGLPKLPFLVMAAVTGAICWKLFQQPLATAETVQSPAPATSLPALAPLKLQLSPEDYYRVTETADGWQQFVEASGQMQETLLRATGLSFPPLVLESQPEWAEGSYAVLIDEVPVARGQLPPQRILVTAQVSEILPLLATEHHTEIEPVADGLRLGAACWVPAAAREALCYGGINPLDSIVVVIKTVEQVLRQNPLAFFGLQEVRGLLDQLQATAPSLSEEVERAIPLPTLTQVLRTLVEEGVSIRNGKKIAEFLLRNPKEKEAVQAEQLRYFLREQLCYDLSQDGVLLVYQLGENASLYLENSYNDVTGLKLNSREVVTLLGAIRQRILNDDANAGTPVLLINYPKIRRALWEELRKFPDLPPLAVLSTKEVSAQVVIQSSGEIEI